MKRILFHVFGILTAGIVYIVWGVREVLKHRGYISLPKKEQNDERINKRIAKAGITAVVGAVLFVGAVVSGSADEPKQEPEAKAVEQSQPEKDNKLAKKKEADQPAKEKPKTPEQAVKQLVADELGDTVNIDNKKRVKSVEVSVKTLRIKLRADDSLTIGLTSKGMLDDIRRIGP